MNNEYRYTTVRFFKRNIDTYEDAVVDKVNVGYDIYRIKTELTEQGNTIKAGTAVEIRDCLTKQKRLEVLDQQEEWLAQQVERDQNLRSRFRKYLMNREAILKCNVSNIIAKDDDHCDRIYQLVRDKFAGQKIRAAEGCPKGQAAWTQPDQGFDEDIYVSKLR